MNALGRPGVVPNGTVHPQSQRLRITQITVDDPAPPVGCPQPGPSAHETEVAA